MINRDYYLKQHETVEYLGCYLDSDQHKTKSLIETKQLFELFVLKIAL